MRDLRKEKKILIGSAVVEASSFVFYPASLPLKFIAAAGYFYGLKKYASKNVFQDVYEKYRRAFWIYFIGIALIVSGAGIIYAYKGTLTGDVTSPSSLPPAVYVGALMVVLGLVFDLLGKWFILTSFRDFDNIIGCKCFTNARKLFVLLIIAAPLIKFGTYGTTVYASVGLVYSAFLIRGFSLIPVYYTENSLKPLLPTDAIRC